MPSLAGFFLLPLLGGFFFLYFLNTSRFFFRKQEGHRLFLLAAIWGAIFFSIARGLTLALAGTPLGQALRSPLKAFAGFDFSGSAIGALLLGLTLPWIGNLRWRSFYAWPVRVRDGWRLFSWDWWRPFRVDGSRLPLQRGLRWNPQGWPFRWNYSDALLKVAREGDELLYLLLQAQAQASPILLIFDNGKAYVGFVLQAHLAPELPYFKLLPAISGYQIKDTLELELTTSYKRSEDLLRKLAEPGGLTLAEQEELNRLQIVLKRDKIVSARFFNPDLYRSHREERTRRTQTAVPPPQSQAPPAQN
jgi:hypothetical protein